MDKILSIRKNEQVYSLFVKVQEYLRSANRTDIVNAAIQKALYDRESGGLNWKRIASAKIPSVYIGNENCPEFMQLRVDQDQYTEVVNQMKTDFALEKVSPAPFVVKLLLKYYLLFLIDNGVEIIEKREETYCSLEEFKKLPSEEKLNVIYEMLLDVKNLK